MKNYLTQTRQKLMSISSEQGTLIMRRQIEMPLKKHDTIWKYGSFFYIMNMAQLLTRISLDKIQLSTMFYNLLISQKQPHEKKTK